MVVPLNKSKDLVDVAPYMGVEPKIGGFPPKSSILLGVFHYFTIHFGVPLIFGNTHFDAETFEKNIEKYCNYI